MLDEHQRKGFALSEETGLPVLPPERSWKVEASENNYERQRNIYKVSLIETSRQKAVKFFGITFRSPIATQVVIGKDETSGTNYGSSINPKDEIAKAAIRILKEEESQLQAEKAAKDKHEAYLSLLGTYPGGKSNRGK